VLAAALRVGSRKYQPGVSSHRPQTRIISRVALCGRAFGERAANALHRARINTKSGCNLFKAPLTPQPAGLPIPDMHRVLSD